ncbi:MAG: hypothetical protein LBD58_04265 [Treponema sp.]|nr:hypothetical protein [Treponema sp.]
MKKDIFISLPNSRPERGCQAPSAAFAGLLSRENNTARKKDGGQPEDKSKRRHKDYGGAKQEDERFFRNAEYEFALLQTFMHRQGIINERRHILLLSWGRGGGGFNLVERTAGIHKNVGDGAGGEEKQSPRNLRDELLEHAGSCLPAVSMAMHSATSAMQAIPLTQLLPKTLRMMFTLPPMAVLMSEAASGDGGAAANAAIARRIPVSPSKNLLAFCMVFFIRKSS